MLRIQDLSVELNGDDAGGQILRRVSVHVEPGEIVGLVGESGSGKSTTAKAAMGLYPEGSASSGSVWVGDEDVLRMDPAALRTLRTRTAAMVFQDPRTTLNPVRTVGDFLTEQLRQLGWK